MREPHFEIAIAFHIYRRCIMRLDVFPMPAHSGVPAPVDGDSAAGGDPPALESPALLQARARVAKMPQAALLTSIAAADHTVELRDSLQQSYNAQGMGAGWAEMYELCGHLRVEQLAGRAASGPTTLRTFHCGALPGSAICALNHYLATNSARGLAHTIALEWAASAPYPDSGEDEFNLLSCNRDRWVMDGPLDAWPAGAASGEFASGDIAHPKGVGLIADRAIRFHRQPVDMYVGTARVSSGELGQSASSMEEMNALAHVGQAACGLMCLRKGGTMALKSFGWTLPAMQSLTALLANCFEEFSVVRPGACTPDNPEFFLVGRGLVYDTKYAHALGLKIAHLLETPLEIGRPLELARAHVCGRRERMREIADEIVRREAQALAGHAAGAHKKGHQQRRRDFAALWLSRNSIVRIPAGARLATAIMF